MDLNKLIDRIERDCYSDKFGNAVEEMDKFIEIISGLVSDYPQLVSVLKVMMRAMEKEDYILIGDCLEYGIKPLLNNNKILENVFNDDLDNLPDIKDDIYYYTSYSDEPVLCVKDNDDRMIRLNSLFSPVNEVKEWLDNLDINNRIPVVCLFGIGTGLFAEALLKKIDSNSKLIIYEPDRKILDYCLGCGKAINCDIAEKRISDRIERILSDERVCFIIEDEGKVSFRYKLQEILNYLELTHLVVTKHNGYEKVFSKSYLSFLREINDHRIKMYTNKNTMAFFKEHFVDDFLKNLWAYKRMNLCYEIDNILPDEIPVIIVSAGPSLEKNIDVLHQAKGHCLIFAVDTAVRYLLAHGILPDLIITIDSIKPASYFSDERAHEIPCIFDVTANPEILKNHKGRVFLYNSSNFYVCGLFERIGKHFYMNNNGGSVATAAFALLYMLRQRKIIMIGQDLASKNGITHAGGVNDGCQKQEMSIEGYYGDKVVTRSDWLGYLKWFEKAIVKICEDNKNESNPIRVIDATEGGAKIHGAEQMTLQEAIEDCRDVKGQLPDYDFKKELEKLDYYLNEDEYKELIRQHKAAVEKLKEIEIKADDAIRICESLIKGIENNTVSGSFVDREKKKITKIIEWCSQTTIFPMVNNYLITDVIDDVGKLKFAEGDIRTTEKNGIELMKISFEAIAEASKVIYQKAEEFDKGDYINA